MLMKLLDVKKVRQVNRLILINFRHLTYFVMCLTFDVLTYALSLANETKMHKTKLIEI